MIVMIKNMVRVPTATEIMQRDLESAQRERLRHMKAAEEHSAWVSMLDKRVSRIQQELLQQPIETNPTTKEIVCVK